VTRIKPHRDLGAGIFRVSFEILFNSPQELIDLLSELEKRIKSKWGGSPHLSSSSLLWGSGSEMVRIAFSEQIERGGLSITPGLLRASGVVECVSSDRCVEIYEEIYETTRLKNLRIRLTI
jgi:hypothetical protein